MKADPEQNRQENLRGDTREDAGKNASVEFMPGTCKIPYHFKLKDFSSKGFGILVRKDSKVLKHINPGDILDMRYYPEVATADPVPHRTQIKHISEPEPGTHQDHLLVGLLILDQA
jgi:hypothetical protein